MGLWIRFTLRNIAVKPFRTLVIVLCLAAVSLTFSLCLTVSRASGEAVEEQIRGGTGRTDIVISGGKSLKELPVLPEGVKSVAVVQAPSYLQRHSIDNYKYVQKKKVYLLGLDAEEARDFGLLPECTQPAGDEAVISYSLAAQFGFGVGDRVALPCADGSEITLTVSEVVLNKKLLSVYRSALIVSPETAKKALGSPDIAANAVYADAPDGAETETAEQIRRDNPGLSVEQMTGTDEMNDVMSGMTRTFFIIFVVTLLMIFFIIAAFSKNIAAERLSAIGTLRSIGAEKRTAALTLLAECAVYGLAGGAIGLVLFCALKDVLLSGMMPSVNGLGGSVHAPVYIPLTGMALSAAVSCVVSMTSVMRTSRMPIRDIIFGGKDSVYRPSRPAGAAGAVLTACSVGLYVFADGFATGIAALAAFVIGLCLLLPLLLSRVSALTARFSCGGKMPVLRLALIQSGTKKTDVTATVICTAALLLTASLFVLSRSAEKLYTAYNYDCDVIVTGLGERAERYRSITADRKEFIYCTEEQTGINGSKASVIVFGYDGFEMFSGIKGLPASLGENEIAFDSRMMKRLGISEGDEVDITLKSNTLRPVTLTLTATSGIDSVYYDSRCCAAVIGLDTYRSVYHDYPSVMLADGDPGLIAGQLTDSGAEAETAEEYYLRQEEDGSGVTGLLYALAAMGMLLAVLSVSGSQMIGFEQRRHELAVLRSQGMSRGQLSKMLLAETAFTALIPVVILLLAGRFAVMLVTGVLASLDINVPISYERPVLAAFVLIMSAAVLLTVLMPVHSLGKMNTAAELKCE